MTTPHRATHASGFALPHLGSVPREAHLRRGRWILLAFLFLLGMGFAGGFFYGGRSEYEHLLALAEDGATAEGVLLEKERKGGKTKRYELRFRYTVEGRVYRGSGDVDRARFDALEPGASLLVTYLPSDPWQARLGRVDEGLARSRRNLFWFLAAFLGGGLLTLTALLARFCLGRVALLRRGSVREARITEVKTAKKGQTVVSYVFRDGEGVERRGRAMVGAKEGGVAVGDALAVLHDPQVPSRFDLVDRVLRVAVLSKLSDLG
jgi:hypothetical protein